MLFINRLLKFNLQTSIYLPFLIATFHLMILTFRTYGTVIDIINLEDLVDLNQALYIILVTLLQIVVIALLYAGIIKRNHLLLLPWLCFTGPIFVMVTTYSILYLPTGDQVQNLINFGFVGLFWLAWYAIYNSYTYMKLCNNNYTYVNYRYSQVPEIEGVSERIRIKNIKLLI